MQTQLTKTEFLSKLKTDIDFNKKYGRKPATAGKVALPCCHYGFQAYTRVIRTEDREKLACEQLGITPQQLNDKYVEYLGSFDAMPTREDLFYDSLNVPKRRLSIKFHQRSCDSLLGVPFDIASYSILTFMLCKELNMVPDELIFTGGDCHIYLNHLDQVETQLKREPYPNLPKLVLKGETGKSIFDYTYDDFEIVGYEKHPAIKAPIAV